MNRYLGFNCHRYGDLFMNLVACRIVKQLDPGSHLTFAINGNYRNAAPLFLDQPDIDQIHITHSPVGDFDDVDRQWIASRGFRHVFNPMQDHPDQRWFMHRCQPLEVAHMHGLEIPADETGKLHLNRWFEPTRDLSKTVALQAFAGSYDPSNKKQLSPKRAQEVVDLICARGYEVLQLGLRSEHRLDNVTFIDRDFFGMVKDILGCRALVTTDSGPAWAASCYDHPTLGLYSHAYYGENRVSAIQPLNPNAIYLNAANVNEIPLDVIGAALTSLL